MNNGKYIKEATYVFKYNGDEYKEYHFVDEITNLRHRSKNKEIEGNTLSLLDVKGTGSDHQIICPALLWERVYSENEDGAKASELLFLLPDINRYVKVFYDNRWGVDEPQWTFTSGVYIVSP